MLALGLAWALSLGTSLTQLCPAFCGGPGATAHWSSVCESSRLYKQPGLRCGRSFLPGWPWLCCAHPLCQSHPFPCSSSPLAPCKGAQTSRTSLTLPLLSPLQGLYIFLVYAIYNSEVRAAPAGFSPSVCWHLGEAGSGSCKAAQPHCASGAVAAFSPWLAGAPPAVLELLWPSHVLALLQVRNAIQRMKDKKKALSFTVSWKESLLPLHPPATHQRRVSAVPWVCFEEMMMERHLIFYFCPPSLQPCWTAQTPR